MSLDAETCHAACEAKDRRFDGRFFVGVTSTGIYCRCICSARTPKRENRRFYASAAAAERDGFRPCFLCRPELAPGLAPIDAPARLASQAYARIEAGALEERGLEALARELGVTDRHLRRVMRTKLGASPIEIAQTARLLAAKRLLADTQLPITEVAFAAGFQSLRRFNAAMKQSYGVAPSAMRRSRVNVRGQAITLNLAARGVADLAPTFEFLSRRAMSGVEIATPQRYARTLQIGAATGWIDIVHDARGVSLTLSESLAPALRPLVAAVRGTFDLDADVSAVDAHLMREPLIAADVAAEPGVRVAGTLDAFETAIRAVLGQQITVVAARTLADRLVARLGGELEGAPDGLHRVFPSAERIAAAGAKGIVEIGMPMKRAETLHRLAQAVADGKLTLARGAIAAGRAGLAELPGIGPWTIEYIALRALGDPDAFPARDAAIVAALGRRGETLETARPWRAYAATRLWRRAATKGRRA